MAETTVAPIPAPNGGDRTRDSLKRRKRKKIQRKSECNDNDQHVRKLCDDDLQIKLWRSEVQQRVYTSKLVRTLRQQRSATGTVSGDDGVTRRSRTIRETADRVLAATAKGRTRWSRAILTNKLKLKFMKINRRKRVVVSPATGDHRLKKRRSVVTKVKLKNLPAVQTKARVLGGLVPGCRKQRLPVVLEEASSYIPALEMQVKAMSALVQLLSGGGGSDSGTGAGDGDGGGGGGQVSYIWSPPWL